MLRIKMLSIFLITIFLSNICLADPQPTPTPTVGPQPSVLLHPKDPAPFEGFLLPKEKVEEFRIMSLELQKDQALVISLTESLNLEKDNRDKLQNSLNLAIDQNNKLVSKENTTQWEKILWFGVGVLVTGLAIGLGSRVTK